MPTLGLPTSISTPRNCVGSRIEASNPAKIGPAVDPVHFPDLRSFLDRLRDRGDLFEVTVPVSADEEIAEIHRRVIAAGGPALLFSAVEGADHPCVTNLFGTAERALEAFGDRPFRLIERLVEVVQTLPPPTAAKLWDARDLGLAALKLGARRVNRAPVLEVVDRRPDLARLPALKTWPQDGGPFVTLPLCYSEHPTDGGSNLGMYRLQVYDRSTTGMHWQIGRGGGYHYGVAEERGESLPVTVLLGGPPALVLAAIAPLPENVPEMLLASLLTGARLRTCDGPGPHRLVADAEFALVGQVPPRLRREEGPFGDHYGYYSLRHDFPVFELEAIARRRDAIFPATVVGKPR
ncbi:MAG: UbiD family decarboxylase, partial [Pirellulales bacterium]|nr:UbiD family decarboxylase [Pirellulales bacterium]